MTPPTVPTAPARRNLRPHAIRVPSIFGYSVTVPFNPYITLVRGNNTSITQDPHPSRSKIADLLSDADAAWTRQIDHVSRANSTITDPYIALAQQDVHMLNTAMDDTDTGSANSARPLNVNPDGSPLTYRTATHGADSADWLKAEDTEWDRLLGTKTCHAIHLHQQPLDRRGDTTYYNPKPKEKYDDDMNKVYRIRGTAGGDRINYDDPTKAVHGPVTECPAITSDPHSSIIGLTMSSRQLPQHLASPTP